MTTAVQSKLFIGHDHESNPTHITPAAAATAAVHPTHTRMFSMVTVTFDDLLVRCNLGRDRFLGGLNQLILGHPLLVEGGRLELAPLLQSSYDRLRVPADLVGETTELAELTTWLQTQDTQGRGYHETLLFVVRWGDTLVYLQALQGFLSTMDLVGEHTSNGSPKDHARRAVVERSTRWIGVHALLQEIKVL